MGISRGFMAKACPETRQNRSTMDFKNFFSEKYGPFSASLPDIIAAKYSLKPVARLSCTSSVELKKYSAAFRDDGLFLMKKHIRLPKRSFLRHHDMIYFYLSRTKTLAMQACSIDPEYSSSRDTKKNQAKIKDFAAILGYPTCCVDAYLKIGQKKLTLSLNADKNPPFYLNNFLHGTSNHYLSFHLPCSYSCSKSLRYNQGIFHAIQKEFPEFAESLKNILTRPLLVRFWKSQKDTFFDNRGIVILDGILKDGVLRYHSAAAAIPLYARISVAAQNRFFDSFIPLLQGSDRIACDGSHFVFTSHGRRCFELSKRDGSGVWTLFYFPS